MRLSFSKAAGDDLEEIWHYLLPRSRSGAINVYASIQAAAKRAAMFPAAGRPGKVAGTREAVLSDYPYILIYRVEDNELIILRVYHTARDR